MQKEVYDYCKYWENKEVVSKLDYNWSLDKNISCKTALKEWIKKNIHIDDKVLDAGCGTGFYVESIINACGEKNYVGIDVTSKMVEFCKHKFPSITFLQGNILDLNMIQDNAFDVVINPDVLIHIPICKPAIKEFYRVAKKKIVIKTTLTDRPTTGRPMDNDYSKVHWINYNKDEFLDMVKSVTGDGGEIILYDHIRDISSKSKGECRWVLIEIKKSK